MYDLLFPDANSYYNVHVNFMLYFASQVNIGPTLNICTGPVSARTALPWRRGRTGRPRWDASKNLDGRWPVTITTAAGAILRNDKLGTITYWYNLGKEAGLQRPIRGGMRATTVKELRRWDESRVPGPWLRGRNLDFWQLLVSGV